jgi:hypothetical protein
MPCYLSAVPLTGLDEAYCMSVTQQLQQTQQQAQALVQVRITFVCVFVLKLRRYEVSLLSTVERLLF